MLVSSVPKWSGIRNTNSEILIMDGDHIKQEHLPYTWSMSSHSRSLGLIPIKATFVFIKMIKLNPQVVVENMTNRYQVLCETRHIENFFYLATMMSEADMNISNSLNGLRCVIAQCDLTIIGILVERDKPVRPIICLEALESTYQVAEVEGCSWWVIAS